MFDPEGILSEFSAWGPQRIGSDLYQACSVLARLAPEPATGGRVSRNAARAANRESAFQAIGASKGILCACCRALLPRANGRSRPKIFCDYRCEYQAVERGRHV